MFFFGCKIVVFLGLNLPYNKKDMGILNVAHFFFGFFRMDAVDGSEIWRTEQLEVSNSSHSLRVFLKQTQVVMIRPDF